MRSNFSVEFQKFHHLQQIGFFEVLIVYLHYTVQLWWPGAFQWKSFFAIIVLLMPFDLNLLHICWCGSWIMIEFYCESLSVNQMCISVEHVSVVSEAFRCTNRGFILQMLNHQFISTAYIFCRNVYLIIIAAFGYFRLIPYHSQAKNAAIKERSVLVSTSQKLSSM